MFVEPTAGSLAVVVFEPRMLVISVAISVLILGKSGPIKDRYSQGEKNYSAGGKQVSCLHNFLPHLNWAGALRSDCCESGSKSAEPASEIEHAGGSGGRRHFPASSRQVELTFKFGR
jgi:hypothetical protein